MTRPNGLPLFVREALRDSGEEGRLEPRPVQASGALRQSSLHEAERSLLALEDALSDVVEVEALHLQLPDSMLTRVPDRLERLVLAPPYRYGPFFGRLAELFDLSEDAVITELARLCDPGQWRASGVAGVSRMVVRGGPAIAAGRAALVRVQPGRCFPRHRHLGAERVIVLEGSYEDSNGMVHRPGELREWEPGTEHSLNVEGRTPCVFAYVTFGCHFDAWALRALAFILQR